MPRPRGVSLTASVSESDEEPTVQEKVETIKRQLLNQREFIEKLPYEKRRENALLVKLGLQLIDIDDFIQLLEVSKPADVGRSFESIIGAMHNGNADIPFLTLTKHLQVLLKTPAFIGDEVVSYFQGFADKPLEIKPETSRRTQHSTHEGGAGEDTSGTHSLFSRKRSTKRQRYDTVCEEYRDALESMRSQAERHALP